MTQQEFQDYLNSRHIPGFGRVEIKSGTTRTMILAKICTVLQEEVSVAVGIDDFISWKNGELAQNAFWHLDENEREFIISGLTPAEYESIFAEEE